MLILLLLLLLAAGGASITAIQILNWLHAVSFTKYSICAARRAKS